MCQVNINNNDDARPVLAPPVTQDKVTNYPEDVNDGPTALGGSIVCIGNILEEYKKRQRSKMHKSALQHLGIFFCEFRKPSKTLLMPVLRISVALKMYCTRTYVILQTFFWQAGVIFCRSCA